MSERSNRPVCRPKQPKRSDPAQFANRDPDASVYDGRNLLGYLIDEPSQCAALTVDRFLIGLFPDRKAAAHAIITRGLAA
ncbi:hypothetical protein [Bradyrhizobium liaoningense]|uniref:hypothetical protein n=1 Tax=Bradyrhizobium liaoningense TaxID=43992 RepID=UPI001BADA99B|nr:hypothetical protein [Bradyrhizobium liaoningense]MBR0945963.1 hypothetical protein [Bradyrhizobium liaoningense]